MCARTSRSLPSDHHQPRNAPTALNAKALIAELEAQLMPLYPVKASTLQASRSDQEKPWLSSLRSLETEGTTQHRRLRRSPHCSAADYCEIKRCYVQAPQFFRGFWVFLR
jgi:hypothetical protein